MSLPCRIGELKRRSSAPWLAIATALACAACSSPTNPRVEAGADTGTDRPEDPPPDSGATEASPDFVGAEVPPVDAPESSDAPEVFDAPRESVTDSTDPGPADAPAEGNACVPEGQRCRAGQTCCSGGSCPWSNYCGCSPATGPCQFSGGSFPCCAGLNCHATNGTLIVRTCTASTCYEFGTRCDGRGGCCAGLNCRCASGTSCLADTQVCLPPVP